jgi:hypothetical protein
MRAAATRRVWRCVGGLLVFLLAASQAHAFEAFDGRVQAHGFFESQFRTISADYGEDWDVTQWYQVFNLELELDLLQDPIGYLDLLSEVRYDCIYSRGCGMFRSMNTYGDRSKSLPRRLANATQNIASGEIPVRNDGRFQGATTDPVPLADVSGFSGVSDTDGAFITGSRVPCIAGNPNQNRSGVNCFPFGLDGIKPFDYLFERFSDFRFSMVNTKGGSNSGNPVQILGPWLPRNYVSSVGVMSDRVNPFDGSRLNPVLTCRSNNNPDPNKCLNGIEAGNGSRPFRPIPVYAEDRSRKPPEMIQVVVYQDASNGALANPSDPSTYRVLEIDPRYNHGDARFTQSGVREPIVQLSVVFPGDDPNNPPLRQAYDARDLLRVAAIPNVNFLVRQSGDADVRLMQIDPPNVINGRNIAPRTEFLNGRVVVTSAENQARGLFVPSKPLREILEKGDVDTNWPLNLSENDRAWNRGLAQQDEKELKEAYLDLEFFDSQLWMRIGKQQIVWGKTELFRTTDQFNPQDLALATLPSLEESRIALWSARGVWSFYEVGPLEDVRLELAVNIDDYESSDFGSCGEPYTVNIVCSANFGAFAHGFTGLGIIGVEAPPDPWQSLKGWEIGGRLEWRWDKFSFALSDFWGYADLPSVRRVSTYERNVDSQTGRPLVYQGGIDPADRRVDRSKSFADDTDPLWNGIGSGDDPFEDPYGDLRALVAAQQADPTGVTGGTLPGAGGSVRDPDFFELRGTTGNPNDFRSNCGTSRSATGPNANNVRYNVPGTGPGETGGSLVAGADCLTAGPTQLFASPSRNDDSGRADGFDPDDPNCALIDTNGDGRGDTVPATCPYQPTNALDSHHANLTLFTWICSATIGFLDIDPTACAQTVFGSTEEPAAGLAVAEIIGSLLAGNVDFNSLLNVASDQTCNPSNPLCDQPANKGSKFLPFALPIVQLSNDPGDQESLGCQDFQTINSPVADQRACGGQLVPVNYLGLTLSPEQEALLGCGPFWGTNCDLSGIDLLNMEPSIVLQSFAGSSGTLTALDLKRQGIRPEGTMIIDPTTGQPAAFKDPNGYRTDEGLQPGTLPWEALGIGGPLCSTADIGGNFYPRGQETINVPGASGPVARPASRKEALPGCHRKWVDRQNGYLNLAWGAPLYLQDGQGNLVVDPATGLPLQSRDGNGNVRVDYFYYSGDPDPLGVRRAALAQFPDSVYYQEYPVDFPGQADLLSSQRPDIGPGQPFASRRAVAPNPGAGIVGSPQLIVPFANELAGLSWNFQMIGVAFSEEFQDSLETVGDLADPDRPGCDINGNAPARRLCAARLEGGSIPFPVATPAINDPGTIGANRRIVAQMLFAYCGSEYGVIDPTTGRGTCRIDGQISQGITALTQLYQANGINPNDPIATQVFLDTLQYRNVPLVKNEDPDDQDNQWQGPAPTFAGNSRATGRNNIIRNEHCSFITPQFCSTVQDLFTLAGLKRNTVEAGGNGAYGRRTMQWHSGGEITLYAPKRNVLGFALDFAEDRSKSNFSIETTWIENVPTGDGDAWSGSKNTDEFNLTVSVDRPTFVNFLNPNRTLFINSQWFFQYRRGTTPGFGGNGPFNALATLTMFTGYFQDRLNPSITFVHDMQSASGGVLPSINYRFSENFSATVGLSMFYGREQRTDIATNGIAPGQQEQGDWAYQAGAQNGVSIVRDRDEVFLRLRYTF